METPLERPHDQQSRSTQPINEVLRTNARQVNLCVPRQWPRTGNRLAQNFCYLVVGKFVVGWREQHERSMLTSINPHSSRCAVPRSRRVPHDHKVALLQIPDKMIRHELRHQVVAVSEPAAPVTLKR
jgi:hypothetical protein